MGVRGGNAPSELVRERSQKVDARDARDARGLRVRRIQPRRRSRRAPAREIDGVPIPAWYPATLYTRTSLETLYDRFGLEAMRKEPTLTIEADAARGVFALRLRDPAVRSSSLRSTPTPSRAATRRSPRGPARRPRTSRSGSPAPASPCRSRCTSRGSARRTISATRRPAAGEGARRQVFRSAADELASEQLVGHLDLVEGRAHRDGGRGGRSVPDPLGDVPSSSRTWPAPRLRSICCCAPPRAPGRGWGVALRGPNAIDLVPCRFESADPPARRGARRRPSGAWARASTSDRPGAGGPEGRFGRPTC